MFYEAGYILFPCSKETMFFKQKSSDMDNSKNLIDRVKDGVKAVGKVGVYAAVGAVVALAGAKKVEAEVVDFTSWDQVCAPGTNTEPVSNYGDFCVDGNSPSDIMCGAGLLKNGNVIGHWDNLDEYFKGYIFRGSVNVDPTTDIPNENLNALVVGERNIGMIGTIDINGNGMWGTYDDSNGVLNIEEGELIMDPQGILVNDVRGDFNSLPAYLGHIDHMENNGKFPKIEFDSSYAIYPSREGPFDMNDLVDFTDYWLSDCGGSNDHCSGLDFDWNGKLNFKDFVYLAREWNPSGIPIAPVSAPESIMYSPTVSEVYATEQDANGVYEVTGVEPNSPYRIRQINIGDEVVATYGGGE